MLSAYVSLICGDRHMLPSSMNMSVWTYRLTWCPLHPPLPWPAVSPLLAAALYKVRRPGVVSVYLACLHAPAASYSAQFGYNMHQVAAFNGAACPPPASLHYAAVLAVRLPVRLAPRAPCLRVSHQLPTKLSIDLLAYFDLLPGSSASQRLHLAVCHFYSSHLHWSYLHSTLHATSAMSCAAL